MLGCWWLGWKWIATWINWQFSWCILEKSLKTGYGLFFLRGKRWYFILDVVKAISCYKKDSLRSNTWAVLTKIQQNTRDSAPLKLSVGTSWPAGPGGGFISPAIRLNDTANIDDSASVRHFIALWEPEIWTENLKNWKQLLIFYNHISTLQL